MLRSLFFLGPNYIRPNQSYIFGSKRREQVIHDEHKQIMTPLTCHLIRYHHIPNTATIVKTISDRLQVYLRRCYTMPLSYLNIYRVRKEFKLMKAIRYRLKKGNYILRTSDKSGIFHLGHVKDYKRKAQAYQERTQAYVELTGDNLLSVIFRKVACLLNELRSKKHIQAGQLERMMPKFDTVSLGYLYFIPKPHKVNQIVWNLHPVVMLTLIGRYSIATDCLVNEYAHNRYFEIFRRTTSTII